LFNATASTFKLPNPASRVDSLDMFTPLEIKKAKRWLVLAEIPAGIFWSGFGITYLTGFFLALKASTVQIGLISAIPSICSLAAIFGGWLIGHTRRWRSWVIALLTIAFLAHAFIGAIPYLFASAPAAIQIQIALIALGGAYMAFRVQDIFWYSWASEIIPEGQRGNFFGQLIIIVPLIGMPFNYLIGRYLDLFNDLTGFCAVFGICGLVGTLMAMMYRQVPDARAKAQLDGPSLMNQMRIVLRDVPFQKFLLFVFTFTLATGTIGPFASVFMIENLRIPYAWIAIFAILYSIFFTVFSIVWGYLVDKYGSRPILLLCCVPLAVICFLWVLNTPDRYFMVPVIHIISGIVTAGMAVALQNLVMDFSSRQHSAAYLSVYQIVFGIIGFAAPLLGSSVVLLCRDLNLHLLGYSIGRYHVLFALVGLLSFLPLFFITRIHEPGGKPAWFVLRNMLMVNPLNLVFRLFAYHHSFDEKTRLNATVGLGRTGSPIVVSELVNTLDDPIYFVRREAALALGRIGDCEAVMPLIAKMADECANIQYEAAWALGNIKDGQSIPPLLKCLQGPDPKLRGYAAMALGEIGAAAAIEPLLERLENGQDAFETTCAANALSRLGYKGALWKILEKLVASDQSVIRRQLTVSLGDMLGTQGSFYRLLTHEERVYGEEVSRILTRMTHVISKKRKANIDPVHFARRVEALKQIEDFYATKRYMETLRGVVFFSDLLFAPKDHRYNEAQEVGRRFLHELLAQNEALGNRVYWEESLVSIYALKLIFETTQT